MNKETMSNQPKEYRKNKRQTNMEYKISQSEKMRQLGSYKTRKSNLYGYILSLYKHISLPKYMLNDIDYKQLYYEMLCLEKAYDYFENRIKELEKGDEDA